MLLVAMILIFYDELHYSLDFFVFKFFFINFFHRSGSSPLPYHLDHFCRLQEQNQQVSSQSAQSWGHQQALQGELLKF